jgi:hypothetical protein
MAFNLFEAPEYYQGLLGEDATKKLQNRALTTGLVNAAIGYLAQPKTGGYGSALPYLGRALAGGLQAGQETIRSGLTDFETQQKIAEMQRKQKQQQALQGMLSGITDPNERLLAELNTEAYVTNKLKPRERKVEKVGRQLVDVTGDTPTVLFTGEAEEKTGASTSLNKLLTERAALAQTNPNDPNLKFYDDAIRKETTQSPGVNVSYGAPMSGMVDGKPVFFQVPKSGGAPTIIPGITPPESPGNKPTEFQAKAGLYYKSMDTASKTLNDLESKDFKFMPTLAESAIDEGSQKGQIALSAVRGRTRKSYVQAQKQWIDSINRVRSGANLPEIEYNRAVATFFPQVNEPAAVIEQKRLARQQEEQAMKTAAGNALPAQTSEKRVVRTGTEKGTNRKIVQYSDGTTAYGD